MQSLKLVKDRMMKTFAWRRREIAEGISTEDLLKRYPFLRTSAGVRRVMLMPTLATDRGLGWQEDVYKVFSENMSGGDL